MTRVSVTRAPLGSRLMSGVAGVSASRPPVAEGQGQGMTAGFGVVVDELEGGWVPPTQQFAPAAPLNDTAHIHAACLIERSGVGLKGRKKDGC